MSQKDEKEPFVLPENISDLHDLATQLWFNYFKPAEPLTKAQKKEIREQYNLVANTVNERQKAKVLQLLTESTVWVEKEGKERTMVKRIPQPAKEPAQPAKRPGKVLDMQTAKETPVKKTRGVSRAKSAPAQEGSKAEVKPQAAAPAGPGKIEQILAHYKAGLTKKEIIALGFNKSTVNRQVGEFIQRQKLENETK